MTNSATLTSWLLNYLPDHVALPDRGAVDGGVRLEPVSGDAGFRSYYRVNTQPTLIAVNAPPETENNPDFVRKGLAFSQAGVHSPKIYAVDYRAGFLLLEDLGERVFLSELKENPRALVYPPGLETLLQIQRIPPLQRESSAQPIFADYSAEIFDREMQLFPQWFVEQLLGLSLQSDESALLQATFDTLSTSALSQPQVVVHRDFQIRNLLLLDNGGVGVIDYQDALIGPITYDLVSLLRDCYIHLSDAQIDHYLDDYLNRATAHYGEMSGGGLEPLPDSTKFRRDFDLMGLQRHIKVLGIFARLHLRDNKPSYLAELPLFIRYVLEVAERYPETQPFRHWFGERVLPELAQQDWYANWETAGERE
ncbi:MAG: phosphotransferase [Porticoccaceae bacterium]